MFKATVHDRITLTPLSRREYTDEGFLCVPGRAARTGIQEYTAGELGIKDRAPGDIIKVYRPPEEVFSTDSLASFAGADITVEHPTEMVNSDTYKEVSIGTIRGVGAQDGDFVTVDMIIKDKDGIKTVESGKVQLSVGYTAVYDSNVPDGADYEFIQRDIKVNHVALVDRARAGAQARLFDSHREGKPVMAKITLDAGRVVEIEDSAQSILIQDTLDRKDKMVKDAEEKSAKMEAERDEAKEDAEEAKKASSDSAIAKRVSDIATVMDGARKIAGKDFTSKSLDTVEIKREALASKRPSVDWSDKEPGYITASFDIGLEKEDKTEDEEEEEKTRNNDSMKRLAQDGAGLVNGKHVQTVNDRRTAFEDGVTGAWRKTAHGGAVS